MRTLNVGRGIFTAVCYTPDGRTLVSLNSRRYLRFWDLVTFKERLSFVLSPRQIFSCGKVCWHGSLLSVNNTVFDASATLELLSQPATGKKVPAPLLPIQLAGAPENHLVAIGDSGTIASAIADFVWSHGRGRWNCTLSVWQRPEQRSHTFTGSIQPGGFTISSDGKRLAGCEHRDAVVYDIETGKEVIRYPHTDMPQQTRFSADGRLLAVAAGRTVWLWKVGDKENLARFPSFRRHCVSLAFHPTAPLLVAGGREGEIRMFDTQSLRETLRYDWDIGAVHGLAFAPDGTTAAAAGHRSAVVVWDVD